MQKNLIKTASTFIISLLITSLFISFIYNKGYDKGISHASSDVKIEYVYKDTGTTVLDTVRLPSIVDSIPFPIYIPVRDGVDTVYDTIWAYVTEYKDSLSFDVPVDIDVSFLSKPVEKFKYKITYKPLPTKVVHLTRDRLWNYGLGTSLAGNVYSLKGNIKYKNYQLGIGRASNKSWLVDFNYWFY